MRVIIPSPELSGNTFAYQHQNKLYVSPAIYECLQDADIKDLVMQQVMVKMLSEIVNDEIKNICDDGNW